MEKEILTREQLYNLVWSLPLLTLSKKYAISDVGLRKICIRMEIPLPRAGHWQKIQFGKSIDKPDLSAGYSGEKEVSLSLRTEEMKDIPATPSPSKILQKKIETEMTSVLSVPDRLSNPDKLIVVAKESLNKRDRYEHNGMVSCERGELDIKVARANIPRALRFMDSIIKILRKRGHGIEFRNDKTCVHIDDQYIEIRLREKLRKEIVKGTYYDSTVYKPNGLLAFQLGSYNDKEWKDGKMTIEEMLSAIIAKIEIVAEERKECQIQRQKEQEIRAEEERIRKEYEKRKEKDLSEFKSMLLKSSRWHKAVNLRNYIDEVEAKAQAKDCLDEELKSWIIWARSKADWYDPFTETTDELLQEIDRETLEPIKKSYSYSW
ncbi:MAG: hypothetical protein QM725_12030 [Lacibacter sp.]